jgi:hypothetical protein
MDIWKKIGRWVVRSKLNRPGLCKQAKQKGVEIPPKVNAREAACLNAKAFIMGMGEETRKVLNPRTANLKMQQTPTKELFSL